MVQSSLILDIDFPLLLPLTLLFLLGYLKLRTSRRWLWLVPLQVTLLWAKMTNPIPLALVVTTWEALRGHLRRAAVDLLVLGLGAAVVFLGSWWLLSTWLGFPFAMPFEVNLVQWQDSADVAHRAYTSPGAFIAGLQPTVLWLGPGLVALGLIGSALRVAQLVRTCRFHGADLLIGLAIVLVLGYVNKSAGWFPKYQVALAPLLACLAAPVLATAWCASPLSPPPPKIGGGVLSRGVGVDPRSGRGVPKSASRRGLSLCLLACVAALATAGINLALVRDDWALQRTWTITPPAATALLAIVAAAATIGFVAHRHKAAASAAALAGLAGLALGWSLATDLSQLQANYSTTYWYGTSGTAEAATWVDQHLPPDAPYLAAKEVATRSADQQYVDQDNIVYALSTGRGFDGTWAGQHLAAAVTWQRDPFVANLLSQALPAAGFSEAARFGDYVIYVPVPGS